VYAAFAAAAVLHLLWVRFVADAGGDLAAQDAWAAFARSHPGSAYNLAWYGGMYPVSYSAISPYVMAILGVRTTMVLAGTISAAILAYLIIRTGVVRRPLWPALYGAVALTGKVVDGAGADVTGWTVTLPASVDVPPDGQQTAVVTVKVPSAISVTAATLKIGATTTLGTETAESAVTANKVLTWTVNFNAGANQCVYPAAAVGTVDVTNGTKIRFLNNDTTSRITIHVQGDPNSPDNFNHQPDPGSAPGTAYGQTPTSTGNVEWYCHSPGPTVNNLKVQVLAPAP
jgi:plastocyanin